MQRRITKMIGLVKDELKLEPLLRGVIALLPFAVLYLKTNNPLWLESSVLTMSTLIVEERLELTALGVLIHGFLIIALFYLLFLTQLKPILFVFSCSLAASTIIYVTTRGEKLRHLGTWTFIPAIIMATEFAAATNPALIVQQAPEFLPYLFIALLPSILFAQFDTLRATTQHNLTHYHPLRLSGLKDFGVKNANYESLIAMASAVFISSFLVEYMQMENGQWMIWGSASVVTGSITTTPKKFRERITGVSVGVPLGIIFGSFIIPYTPFALTISVCAVFLTLVSFRRYIIAYTFRCMFVATSVMLATHSANIASERFTHVILGGLIGFASVFLCHLVAVFYYSHLKR